MLISTFEVEITFYKTFFGPYLFNNCLFVFMMRHFFIIYDFLFADF
jgi:hypothetical protein